jgi:hypothetical protein
MFSAKQDNRKTNHAMLPPQESTECRHKIHASAEVVFKLNGDPRHATGTIIDKKGKTVSIEASLLMKMPVPRGAHR